MTQKLLELHCRPKQTLTHPRGVAEEEEDHAIFFPIESVAAVRVGVVVLISLIAPYRRGNAYSTSFIAARYHVTQQKLKPRTVTLHYYCTFRPP